MEAARQKRRGNKRGVRCAGFMWPRPSLRSRRDTCAHSVGAGLDGEVAKRQLVGMGEMEGGL